MGYRCLWSQTCAESGCHARLEGDDISEGGIFAIARADGWAVLAGSRGPRFLCPRHKPAEEPVREAR